MKKLILTFCVAVGAMGVASAQAVPAEVNNLLKKNACLACHTQDKRLVGPAYKDVAKKKYTVDQIIALIAKPKPSNWPGYPPMAPLVVPKPEAKKIAEYIVKLK